MALMVAMLLLLAANGAPILAERWFGRRWACPLDGGLQFFDKRPLLGKAKTCRGIAAALLLCAVIVLLLGLPLWLGILFAAYAMLGDLLSSFSKRRLAIPPSGRALGLDQIPESLIPLWLLHEPLRLNGVEVAMLVTAFFVIELGLSRLLYHWHIRNRPY